MPNFTFYQMEDRFSTDYEEFRLNDAQNSSKIPISVRMRSLIFALGSVETEAKSVNIRT